MIDGTRLGWTLIHFLWQGALLAFCLWAMLPLFRAARVRYALASGFLVAAALTPVFTFSGSAPPAGRSVIPLAMPLPVSGSPGTVLTTLEARADWVAWIPIGWIAGVAILSLRLFLAWWATRALANTGVTPLDNRWGALADRIGVKVPVRFAESVRATAPSVIGALRPLVLLPAAVLRKLPVEQLEAIVAHELAHIRRYDYLVNWIQAVVETALFYHPAVWWISSVVRREREVCCDEIAVGACGQRGSVLAHALVALEAIRAMPETSVAATGGHLQARIRRMLGESPLPSPAPLWTLAALVLFAGLVLGPEQAASQQAKPSPKPVAAVPAPDPREKELVDLRTELSRARAELERLKSEIGRSRPPLASAKAEGVQTRRQSQPAARIEQEGAGEQVRAEGKIEHRKMSAAIKAKVRESIVNQVAAAIAGIPLTPVAAPQSSINGPRGPYRKWVDEDVVYIVTPEERSEFESLTSEAEIHAFIDKFWRKRNPSPGSNTNEARDEHYRRIAWANERLAMKGIEGWRTHRGRMYIVNGPPDEIQTYPGKEEFWTYRSKSGETARYRFALTGNSEPAVVK